MTTMAAVAAAMAMTTTSVQLYTYTGHTQVLTLTRRQQVSFVLFLYTPVLCGGHHYAASNSTPTPYLPTHNDNDNSCDSPPSPQALNRTAAHAHGQPTHNVVPCHIWFDLKFLLSCNRVSRLAILDSTLHPALI